MRNEPPDCRQVRPPQLAGPFINQNLGTLCPQPDGNLSSERPLLLLPWDGIGRSVMVMFERICVASALAGFLVFGRHNHSVVCRSLKEVGRLSWRTLSFQRFKQQIARRLALDELSQERNG